LNFAQPAAFATQIGGVRWAGVFRTGLDTAAGTYGGVQAVRGLADGDWNYTDVFNLLGLVPFAVPAITSVDEVAESTDNVIRASEATGVDVAGSKREVFRALREDEDPSLGLRARSPGANTKVGSHVMGKKQSDLISTTKDRSKAEGLFNSGNGVVGIDLDKVSAEVIDASQGVGKGRVFARTKSHQEVLIRDTGGPNPPIPPEAIRIIQEKK